MAKQEKSKEEKSKLVDWIIGDSLISFVKEIFKYKNNISYDKVYVNLFSDSEKDFYYDLAQTRISFLDNWKKRELNKLGLH